ncbi:Imidazole glycerol phosphate synthase subunit HisF [Salinivirga cyanobacteriivorans]|uniref:Imidazole glycerol phosphate synthase subunit HisF n=1 Tax=Salinivirga cyanobacteriivorans TaxID=1307839 RepID=A0A0S2I064_9BACT|nr:imidazole glycerol phosphate synthase subunit HisF [Salinivirga cyanobacteriivorans]ALO15388.1 Imidazole glycerol phosphate synthase subunit HisF [Salinivirga cyanobacteriivorans]
MLTKRIIPCLDVRNGRTVKGINFKEIKDVGDPVDLGKLYSASGADELVYLDITASQEERNTFPDLVKRIARHVNIPFTVGGGIKTAQDASVLLKAGADKVSINSAALANPKLINDIALAFGNQCVVLAIDAKLENDQWNVYAKGGTQRTTKELYSWAQEGIQRGAGEILFTSMNHDGTTNGFANEALQKLSEKVHVPVIASGGAGSMDHFAKVFNKGKADAALAASVFHYNQIQINDLKLYLQGKGITMRI